MQPLRLRGRKTSERLMRKGQVFKGKHLMVRYMPGAPRKDDKPGIYLGTFAGGKLDKRAVVRNRMRRRCREALRVELQQHAELPTAQLLLSPRSSSLEVDFSEIRADARALLTFLRTWQIRPPPVSSVSR